jgi:CHAD domain-containing protein
MSTTAQVIQKRWKAEMRNRWKTFSRQWTRLRRRYSPAGVHAMRSASRRLAASICVAELSAGIATKQVYRRMERISDRLGPLRDNYVYRKTLDRLNSAANARSFVRFLEHQKSEGHKRLNRFFGRHGKRSVHRRIDKIERRLARVSRDWTVDDFRSAFEKALLRRYEALLQAHQAWENSPDNKLFHRMRVELRDLRYAAKAVAEILDLSGTREVRTSNQVLKSLQTTMGEIHDIHKLRTKLVAWISRRPSKKRALEMSVASELQKAADIRMVEFKDHSLASGELLPILQVSRRPDMRGTIAANSFQ